MLDKLDVMLLIKISLKPECEVFLERMVRILTQETPIWMKALTMEVLKEICADDKLLT